jgi:uncharacterized protein (TIGR03032 family)
VKWPNTRDLEELWTSHGAEWRDPAEIVAHNKDAPQIDPRLFDYRVEGPWWELLAESGITLFVSREYEHLVLAMSAPAGKPYLSYLAVPHPSGLVIDRVNRRMFLASTRNPNQVYQLKPVTDELARADRPRTGLCSIRPFVPVSTAFFPGSLYIHDLALIAGQLYCNAVGHNAVARLGPENEFKRVWWPKSIERNSHPLFERNYIQLNSIAAGDTIPDSYFSASSALPGRLRPGHLRYKVDRQGVVFSGRSREPICTGLTRPHSARLHKGRIWVANSGYGEFGYVDRGNLEVLTRLQGWTRGVALMRDVAFVATSRVIPKYARYAPGLNCDTSWCGIHMVCLKSGCKLASMWWPWGNQIFAIDWIKSADSLGFPFQVKYYNAKRDESFFYTFLTRPLNTHK